ncbi:hypothetical protein [Succinimonas amylolytica]
MTTGIFGGFSMNPEEAPEKRKGEPESLSSEKLSGDGRRTLSMEENARF